MLAVTATVMCIATRQTSTSATLKVKIQFILRATCIVSRHWSVTSVSRTPSKALNLRLLYNSSRCFFLLVSGHGTYFGMSRRMQAFRNKAEVVKNKINGAFCIQYEPYYWLHFVELYCTLIETQDTSYSMHCCFYNRSLYLAEFLLLSRIARGCTK